MPSTLARHGRRVGASVVAADRPPAPLPVVDRSRRTAVAFAVSVQVSRFPVILIVAHAVGDTVSILGSRSFSDAAVAVMSAGYVVLGIVQLRWRPGDRPGPSWDRPGRARTGADRHGRPLRWRTT